MNRIGKVMDLKKSQSVLMTEIISSMGRIKTIGHDSTFCLCAPDGHGNFIDFVSMLSGCKT